MGIKPLCVYFAIILLWTLLLGLAVFFPLKPYLLFVLLDTACILLFSRFVAKKRTIRFITIFLSLVFTLCAGTCLEDRLLEKKVMSFDIDGDTIFSPTEQTTEQQEWFRIRVNNRGRLFQYALAFPYSLLVACLYVLFCKIRDTAKSRRGSG